MKSTTYLNIVLTFIAVALTFNVLKDLQIIPVANAATKTNTIVDVNIKEINGRIFFGGEVPVSVNQNKKK